MSVARTWRDYVRPQDFVWLLFFSALTVFGPQHDPVALAVFAALGVVQVLEPRLGAVASVALKLALCYPLIYYGGGIGSSFYLILFLPVITAATNFGLLGTAAVSFAACGLYLSFLLFVDFSRQVIPPDQVRELVLRVLFLPVVAFLTHQLAEANRSEARKLQVAAGQLEKANRSLQEAQAEVRRSERLAALGQLTAGLAHELRNPLATIKNSAEMLAKQAGPGIAGELAGYIAQEVDRTSALVTRFLDFARPRPLRLERAELNEVLDRAIARFEAEHGNGAGRVSVFKNFSPDVPPVWLDPALMEHVVSNLLANARQASPTGAAITVKTQLAKTDSGPAAEISVIDRGSGIDPQHLEAIFNPFFTTKPDGVGLGLAIVSKIVDEHGGRITVETVPGEGSVFLVYLPLGDSR
jgi:two-component system sensor histidine kinase HydH